LLNKEALKLVVQSNLLSGGLEERHLRSAGQRFKAQMFTMAEMINHEETDGCGDCNQLMKKLRSADSMFPSAQSAKDGEDVDTLHDEILKGVITENSNKETELIV
jgi:hypothetical protein